MLEKGNKGILSNRYIALLELLDSQIWFMTSVHLSGSVSAQFLHPTGVGMCDLHTGQHAY